MSFYDGRIVNNYTDLTVNFFAENWPDLLLAAPIGAILFLVSTTKEMLTRLSIPRGVRRDNATLRGDNPYGNRSPRGILSFPELAHGSVGLKRK